MMPLVDEAISPSVDIKIIAIGVSTGGPTVLQTILTNLENNFIPIVIVQHISVGFLTTLVDWLKQTTKKDILIAADNELLKNNCVYFAPDNAHMGINKRNRIYLSHEKNEHGVKPSVSYLFRSIRESFGARSIAILLTGMGQDGVDELKKLKDEGAITIVQDKESSVIHGMPGEAIIQHAAKLVLTPLQIASFIQNINNKVHHG